MDGTSLETFIRVAEEGSFSRAADKLHITQPAISKRIANLEQELGTQLLDRIGKTVRLTGSGEILLQHARKLLDDMHNCKREIQNLNHRVEGTLRIGVSHHIGLYRLPPYLKEYSLRYPRVHLEIFFIDSEQAYPMVLKGELDIALATLANHSPEQVHQEAIWKDALTFVVCDNHLLASANQDQPLTLADLAHHPAILPGQDTYTGQLVRKLFESHSQPINHHIETNYLETIKMMVSIGMGWGVLPRTMLNKELRGLQLDIDNLSRNLGYITRQESILSNATTAMINTLKNRGKT